MIRTVLAMKRAAVTCCAAMTLATCVVLHTGVAFAQMSDPYEIFNRHYQAMGGLETLKSQKTMFVEGNLELVGTGLSGTFKEWSEQPIRSRQEVDLSVIQQVSGDNGDVAWTVDQNGKLQIRTDEQTLKDRQVEMRLAQYEHLDPASEIFSLSYKGTDTAAGYTCHVVSVSNTLNRDVTTHYFDTETFIERKRVDTTPEGESQSWFYDYRDVDGVPFSFRQELVQHPSGMQQIAVFTTVEINGPIDATMFEPPSDDVEDFRFTNGTSAENIPFQFIENHIYFPVEIGGKVRLWILDTGASFSVVDVNFARELGLALEGNVKGQGVSHQVDVSFTTLPPFRLPGLEFDSQKAAAIELAPLFYHWIGREVVGILGYDFLSRVVTKVDYAAELISFYSPESFHYDGTGVVLPSPVSQSNLFELPLTVDGQYGGKWTLDLGAGGMAFHYPYAEQHGLLDRPGIEQLGYGAGGSHMDRRMLAGAMEFAGFTVQDMEVSVPMEKGQGAFGHTELTGNIGNSLLRHFVLYLDYDREQVIVEKGANFGHAFPRDNSGLQLAYTGMDSIQVTFVAPGTPADKAGFKEDDLLTTVNGIAVESFDGVVGVIKLLRGAPGTDMAFDIVRGDEPLRLSLTLRDLHAN